MTFHSFFQDQDQILFGGMKVMKDTTVSGEEVAIIFKTSTSPNFVTLPKLTYHLKMNPGRCDSYWKLSIFRCELLVSGRVFFLFPSCIGSWSLLRSRRRNAKSFCGFMGTDEPSCWPIFFVFFWRFFENQLVVTILPNYIGIILKRGNEDPY